MTTKQLGKTTSGWVFALSDHSAWGSPQELIKDLGLYDLRTKTIEVEAIAWGKLPKDRHISPGEGIAFYHTTRAYYGERDKFKHLPRITMIGVLKNIEVLSFDGDMEYRLVIFFEKDIVNNLINNPVIRNETTRHIFQECGIVPGPIKTWYEAPHKVWKEIVKLSMP